MSGKFTEAAWDCPHIKSGAELAMVLALADSADRDNGEVCLSLATLAAMARSSKRAAGRMLARLEAEGLLSVSYKAGPGRENIYRLDVARLAMTRHGQIGMVPTPLVSITVSPTEGGGNVAKLATSKTLPPEAVVWNSFEQLPVVKSFSSARIRSLNARRRDEFWVDHFRSAVEKVAASDFCLGKNNKNWIATFDWMLQADTVAKIVEGKYDNRKQKRPGDVIHHSPQQPTTGKKKSHDRPLIGDEDPDTGKPLTREEIETKYPLADYE